MRLYNPVTLLIIRRDVFYGNNVRKQEENFQHISCSADEPVLKFLKDKVV